MLKRSTRLFPSRIKVIIVFLRRKGNNCFSQTEYTSALRFYHEAVCYLKGLDGGIYNSFAKVSISDQEKAIVKSELAKIKNNMSAVYLKLEKYQKVIDLLVEVPSKDPKGFYRRGMAYKNLGYLEKAQKDLKMAARLSPLDKGIRLCFESVREDLGKI